LLLFGGVTADRYDRRVLLVGLHGLAGVVALALAAAVWMGELSFPLVLVIAVLMGSIQAFVFPARDALLGQVAGSNILKAVAGATLVQLAFQSLGSASGALVEVMGTPAALVLEALLFWVGIPALMAIEPAPRRPRERLRASELLEGVHEVFGSPVLRVPMLLTAGVGLFFLGPYFVAFPVMLRDTWHGSPAALGLLQASFPFAAVIGTLVVFWRGAIRRKGRALLLAQSGGAACLFFISTGVSFRVALAISLLWGLCGSVFLNASRTLFQQAAPETHRARVLSVYNLGLMGAGAIGLPLAGALTRWLGPHGTFRVSALAMLAFLALVGLTTQVRKIR
jgi:MFS family permease